MLKKNPTPTEIADMCDKAASHIIRFGFCKHFLYNTRQARDGTPLNQCQTDLSGAIGVAVHGTPLHLGRDPLTRAVENAIEARIEAPSLAAWCDYRGNGKDRAIALLRTTAARFRRAAVVQDTGVGGSTGRLRALLTAHGVRHPNV